MADDAPQLDYAKPVAGYRWLLRRALLVLLICTIVAAVLPMMFLELHRLRLTRAYDACAAMPPVDVAHSQTPGDLITAFVPKSWSDLNAQMGSSIYSSGTVFLGKLRTPDGKREFLIGVDVASWSNLPTMLNMRVRVIARGKQLTPPNPVTFSDASVMLPEHARLLIVHGGKIDSSDRSHFTIAFSADEKTGLIGGWLKDDGTVIVEMIESQTATTAPAPPSPATSR